MDHTASSSNPSQHPAEPDCSDAGTACEDQSSPTCSMSEAAPRRRATRSDSTLETTWGYYVLGECVGSWGIGEVHQAVHVLRDKPVLIKRLRPSLRNHSAARHRFEQEALSALRLAGDCVANVIDLGDDGDGGLFYSTETLRGSLLVDVPGMHLRLSTLDVARLGVHLAELLARAHAESIVHLDLCPRNIFLQRQPGGQMVPKLMAFSGTCDPSGSVPFPAGRTYQLPDTNAHPCGPTWDVYALGKTLSELLSGCAAEAGATALAVLLQRARQHHSPSGYIDMAQFRDGLSQALDVLESIGSPTRPARIVAVGQKYIRTSTPEESAEPLPWTVVVGQSDGATSHRPAATDPLEPLSTSDDMETWEFTRPVAPVPDAHPQTPPEDVGDTALVHCPEGRMPLWQLTLLGLGVGVLLGSLVIITAVVFRGQSTQVRIAASATLPVPWKSAASGTTPIATLPNAALKLTAIKSPPVPPAAPTKKYPRRQTRVSVAAPSQPVPGPRVASKVPSASPGPRTSQRKTRYQLRHQRRKSLMGKSTRLVNGRRFLEARRHLSAALGIWDSSRLRWLFHVTYWKRGEVWSAIHHLRRAVRMAPRSAGFRLQLAKLYLRVKQRAKACAQIRFVRRANPGSKSARRAETRHCQR